MTERLPHPYPPSAAEKWIFESRVGNAQGSAAVLALTLKAKPEELIGMVGIHQTRPGRAVLGYWIGKPFWNLGLAREAVGELVDLAFRTSEVERIDAQVRVDNPASRAVLEDGGFRLEGVGLVDMPVRGGAFNCQRFQLDRAGWMAAQQVRDAALLGADCVRSAG
jgi:RimJ/RimL family protein N-acetyltransferase